MTDLAVEIAEYCKNVERKPVNRMELIQNYMRDAQITKQWTIATFSQCEVAIEQACKRGLLNRVSETIWIVFEPVVKEPIQLKLF